MICLGIESTAHTFGIGIMDDNGKVYANARDMYVTEKGGMIPAKSADHHAEVCGDVLKKALEDASLTMDDVETAYYLRMEAEDRPGVLADVTKVLGDKGISIEAMIQKEPAESESKANIIMLTHSVMEKQMNEAIAQIEKLEAISGTVIRIRMETLG